MISKKVLLLSAYDATSHRAWRQRLVALFPELEWVELVLPPRHFNWRIRGNSLQWAMTEQKTLIRDYDLLIATSMVDLAGLRGLVPTLSKLPTVVYFHENQFVYPAGLQRKENIEHQLVPLYSALCADRIVFNSQFNRQSFLEGARSLIKKLPDKLPLTIIDRLTDSQVISVPVILSPDTQCKVEKASPNLEVIWNHRWEYDKGIDLLLELVAGIRDQALPIRLQIAGEQFRQQPPQFLDIDRILIEHARAAGMARGNFGFIPAWHDYVALLQRCDVVLSTALHDFQGLAMQEAAGAGCTPLAPNDLVYPEYLDSSFLYKRCDQHADTAKEILARLTAWQSLKTSGESLPQAVLERFGKESVRAQYEGLFEGLWLTH